MRPDGVNEVFTDGTITITRINNGYLLVNAYDEQVFYPTLAEALSTIKEPTPDV